MDTVYQIAVDSVYEAGPYAGRLVAAAAPHRPAGQVGVVALGLR
ncbi:hypothetical protein [Actinoplanes sp. TFC3]|nr:hypothetical protein [Actinoplanes sp. TFC3]